MELGDAELCLKPEELRARGTDLAEMAQVSNFILRRREEGRQKEKKKEEKNGSRSHFAPPSRGRPAHG